jgi:hypothetical protein
VKLSSAANRFNDMLCTDGYSGVALFAAQLGLFDDNKRDSETSERRILSCAPDVLPPPRRVVAAAGTRFIMGHANPDDYKGKTIRVGYVCHETTYLSSLRTLEQVCLGTTGVSAWAGRVWVKDAAYTQQDSNLTPLHHIHLSATESLTEGNTLTFDDVLHLVRSINHGAGGTLVAMCEQMEPGAIEVATLNTGTYDPVLDTTTSTPATVTVVRMRWQSLFAYRNSITPKFEPGDIQVAIAKSAATPVAGSLLTLSDGAWRVDSALSEGSVWLCRATRYGS